MGEDGAQRQCHLDARGHLVLSPTGKVESKDKTEGSGGRGGGGQWAAGDLLRKSRKGGAGGRAQWAGSNAAEAPSHRSQSSQEPPRPLQAPAKAAAAGCVSLTPGAC